MRSVKLSEIAAINPRRDSAFIKSDKSKTTFIPMAAVSAEAGVVVSPLIKRYAEVAKGYTFFREGDVLFAKITPCMQNGKHFIARKTRGGFGFASTEFHVIRPGDKVLAEWIHFYLRQPSVLSEATRHFTGSVGQQRVPDRFLRNIKIPLPPLAEQRRIVKRLANRLATVAEMRVAAENQEEDIRKLPSAFLRQVFSRGKAAKGWTQAKLGETAEIIMGQSPESSYYNTDSVGLPFFQGKAEFGELFPRPVKWCNKPLKIAREGDVLISVRAPVGPTNFAAEKSCIGRGLAAIRAGKSADNHFLFYYLRFAEKQIAALGVGSTFTAISAKVLRDLPIPLPSLAEQRRIVKLLQMQMYAIAETKSVLDSQLEAIRALPAAYLREAFNRQ